MTAKEHAAQRDLVTASLAATRHPDFYSSRRGVARLANDNTVLVGDTRVSATHVVEAAASQAPEGTNAGQDGRPREHAQTRECPACKGTGEIHRTGQSLHPSAGVYVDDPQQEAAFECLTCAGTGSVPVPRVIPGSKRVM